MTSRSVTVVNQLGMHARAAARFVHLATRFESRVRVSRHGREMDGKSIMGILLLAAGCQNVVGPFRADTMRVDDPCYTIREQQRWGRDKLALPRATGCP